jgi:hypothetical protein
VAVVETLYLHPKRDWYEADELGIEYAIAMLMAEDLRTGFVWTIFSEPFAFRTLRAE